ncbi:MAG: hypothetical protein ACRDO7_01425 [Nocardioidaceae bacterium]
MTDNAETSGSPTVDGSAESLRRVRALAGDLVARPLDEPAADRLAALLSDLPHEDRAALRSLARGRGSTADRAYARLTDPGGDQSYPDTPSQGSGPYRPLRRRQQGAHRR